MLLMLGLPSLSNATDLLDIYQHSLENDPVFKQAYSTYMSSGEAIPQARSALYPQLTINAITARNFFNVNAVGTQIVTSYNNNQWQVNASQALFNFQAWAKVQQAKASTKAAQARFNDAAQNLILRVAQAYFQALLARDTLSFAEAKQRANRRQFSQAEERFKVGLTAITSVYEAKAGYDQSVSQVIAAKNNQINQSENLRKLTNHDYEHLSPLRNRSIPLIRPEPAEVNEWINTGLKQNYRLFAAKYSLAAARENIKVKSAGSWPIFEIQGNATQVHNQTDINQASVGSFFLPNRQTNSNVAIAMTFPVFQGGLVESQTRQAQYDFQTTSEQLEQIYRDVIVNSRISYNTIIDGIAKVKADRQTVISQRNSLNSVDAQFEVGTRTMVDVVNAQQRLFEAQQQLASDQYNLINSILNLKYLAGTLNVSDLEEINAWLDTTRINKFPPNTLKRISKQKLAKAKLNPNKPLSKQ